MDNRLLIAAFENKPYIEGELNFSAEDVNTAAINAIKKELNLADNASIRDIRAVENEAFALIEEAADAILHKKQFSVNSLKLKLSHVMQKSSSILKKLVKIVQNLQLAKVHVAVSTVLQD